MPTLTEFAAARIREMAAITGPGGTDDQLMAAALRVAAKWRSQMIANTMTVLNGVTVQHGPFAGMTYLMNVHEGALAARLLGSYESELHPYLMAFAEAGLDDVVDIGSAEGYYAVGMARLLPEAQIHAFDIDEAARTLCGQLAAANGVSDRVHIGGEFSGADFAGFVGKRALVIVDIEGAETDLLDPERWPALKALQIIVETHPQASPGVTQELIRRFSGSHLIALVHQQPKTTPLPGCLKEEGHMDSLLAVWEWRSKPTPWLVMKPKGAQAAPAAMSHMP